MGSAIAVNQQNFDTEVLAKSYEKPVLVDFFAQWCGPCQMLKPILEKLVQEYDFVLAKVDIDQNPELAQTYAVQGVPDVRIALDGELGEGFVGILPEPQLRQLMAHLNLKSGLETGLEQVYDRAAVGDLDAAQAQLSDLLQRYPDNRSLVLEAADFYIQADQLDTADQLLHRIQDHEKDYAAQAKRLRAIIFFRRTATESAGETALDQAFQSAARRVLEDDYSVALDSLLNIVERDRRYRDDGARKAILTLFDLLGNDDPLTNDYRKRLMMVLY